MAEDETVHNINKLVEVQVVLFITTLACLFPSSGLLLLKYDGHICFRYAKGGTAAAPVSPGAVKVTGEIQSRDIVSMHHKQFVLLVYNSYHQV